MSSPSLFMRVHTPALVAALALTAGAPSVPAQSLADVARKEEARRQSIKEPAKTWTNKDLGSGGDVVVPPTPPPDAATSSSATAAEPTEPKSKEPVKDQAYWAGRMKGLRTQLDRDETLLGALESRINALNTDFVSRDDPAQRSQIDINRKKALAEQASLKQQVDTDKKAIADLEEEARRANVPAGWLR
jgi:hypothetical protein